MAHIRIFGRTGKFRFSIKPTRAPAGGRLDILLPGQKKPKKGKRRKKKTRGPIITLEELMEEIKQLPPRPKKDKKNDKKKGVLTIF